MTRKHTESKKAKKHRQSDDESVNLEDDEDYDEQIDSEDKDFIVDDDEVYEEQQRTEKRKKKKHRRRDDEEQDQLDEDDIEVIKENNGKQRRLKKNQVDSDEDKEVKVKVESKAKGAIHKRDQTTASDDEVKQQEIAMQLKDKFVTEEIDEIFGTAQDLKIIEEDIPERLQIKIQNRFNPSEQEIEKEAEWIFKIIVDKLEQTKDQTFASQIQNVKSKISLCISLFRKEYCDIPYITKVRQCELLPELSPQLTWRIFQLDIEYGKFMVQKKLCEDFFSRIQEVADDKTQKVIEHYKNQIFYINSLRELNDFQHLMNFYKSYYQQELEEAINQSGKQVPFQKRDIINICKTQRLDEFSRRCMLHPIKLMENLNEEKQIHKPVNPNITPTEMAKEYFRKEGEDPIDVINDTCIFTAIELASQPDIRKGLKKHIYEYGYVVTAPTDKGKKELDVFNPSYRTKYIDRKISEFTETDLFIDILHNHSMGLINFKIEIRDNPAQKENPFGNRYFERIFDMCTVPNDQSKWKFLRREVFNIINSQEPKPRMQKSFLMSIMDEIKDELKEDAEKYILSQCSDKYRDLINTGYFSLDRREGNQDRGNDPRDLIPQRERLTVMGVVMHPIDNRNFLTTVAVVDQFGEQLDHQDFLNLIPPRRRMQNGQNNMRPGEEDELKKHDNDKLRFQEILKKCSVDLIVVSADCLEARKLKKALFDLASIPQQENEDHDVPIKEPIVIWGRPEIPKLFASSHFSQKLLKNHSFVLKKAICLARWEQDPMNEVLNLWSPIMSENQALNIDLHPLQKHINQARLIETLEEVNIQTVNNIGIDINLLVKHEHWHNQLQFLSGLGPRKAQKLIQMLKSFGKPLQTKKELYESKFMNKFCFISCFAQMKGYVQPEDRDKDYTPNIFDQTRIHFRQYDDVYKIAADCNYFDSENDGSIKNHKIIIEMIKNPHKLREVVLNDYSYKENIRKFDTVGYTYFLDQVVNEFMHPFRDPREMPDVIRTISNQDLKFTNKQLFYCLIDENERTFKEGMIVSATVFRVYDSNGDKPARVLCKLENGLDANINQNDADFFNQGQPLSSIIDNGSIITGRISMIKFGEGKNGEKFDDNFSVVLKCKQSDMQEHDEEYIRRIHGNITISKEDLKNQSFAMQEEQSKNQSRLQIQRRKIQHPRFMNISSVQAIQLLSKEDNGEYYFRPSSKGTDHLTLTWKFHNKNIVHIDIQEHDKALGAHIGSKLKIGEEFYENLHEITERYIIPCNRQVREVTQHPKFHNAQTLDELSSAIKKEKQEDSARIPYRFAILEKYPQYVILSYIAKVDVVKEFIKIKPKGFFFHHQYHYPFQNMINWFKQEFRSRDYQRYLRKATSPQTMQSEAAKKMAAQQHPSNVPMQSSMQVDQTGPAWGAAQDSVKDEPNMQWGAQSQIKDERERNWGDQADEYNVRGSPQRDEFASGAGRGRGRGRGEGGNVCYKCQKPGHFARECPNGDSGTGSKGYGRGRGGAGGGGDDRGPKTCFNCQQQGHMSRDCPEPRRERDGGDAYKRQRRDDGGSYPRKQGKESSWTADNANHVESGWHPDNKFTPGGDGGFGNNYQANQGGWGADQSQSNDKQTPGGW